MLKGTIKKSLFIINEYSLPGHNVMGLTAWDGETRENIIQFLVIVQLDAQIPFNVFIYLFIVLYLCVKLDNYQESLHDVRSTKR